MTLSLLLSIQTMHMHVCNLSLNHRICIRLWALPSPLHQLLHPHLPLSPHLPSLLPCPCCLPPLNSSQLTSLGWSSMAPIGPSLQCTSRMPCKSLGGGDTLLAWSPVLRSRMWTPYRWQTQHHWAVGAWWLCSILPSIPTPPWHHCHAP